MKYIQTDDLGLVSHLSAQIKYTKEPQSSKTSHNVASLDRPVSASILLRIYPKFSPSKPLFPLRPFLGKTPQWYALRKVKGRVQEV